MSIHLGKLVDLSDILDGWVASRFCSLSVDYTMPKMVCVYNFSETDCCSFRGFSCSFLWLNLFEFVLPIYIYINNYKYIIYRSNLKNPQLPIFGKRHARSIPPEVPQCEIFSHTWSHSHVAMSVPIIPEQSG